MELTSPASLLMASRSWGRARSDTRPDSSTMERRDFSPTPPRTAWGRTGSGQVTGLRAKQGEVGTGWVGRIESGIKCEINQIRETDDTLDDTV